ncbi:hypothetical protein [Pedosphaera parvula]|uniref:Uncharacterized protein n=1 Tax=Pedosphaera parvula (strain Ellin514) TaxID=320771 RepID=B9XP42_PEDPL|nr:hypothetical protein [Pedosphaera parvula]EEF58398.1 hypothetical protein Cflav_PD6141 [Pedosphaera parvula Ellin514]
MKIAILTALLSFVVVGCCSTKKTSSGAPPASYQTSSGEVQGQGASPSANPILLTPAGDGQQSWLFKSTP